MNNLIGISGKKGSGKDTVAEMIQYLDFYEENKYTNLSYNDFDNKKHKSKWEIRKFAENLKKIACIILGCTLEDLENQSFKELTLSEATGTDWSVWIVPSKCKKKFFVSEEDAMEYFHNKHGKLTSSYPDRYDMKVRELLQVIGTEFGRELIHPNIWINSLFSEYKQKQVANRLFHRSELFNESGDDLEWSMQYPFWLVSDVRFFNEVDAIKNRNGIFIRVNRDVPFNDHISETQLDNYNGFNYIIDNNSSLEDLLEKVKEIYYELKN